MQLIRYDAMCTAIAECERVDEVKEIRDQAVAIEAYAKQAMNTDVERQACNIRLRAERKVGQMLKETQREPGKRNDKQTSGQREPRSSEYQKTKEQAGISDTQAKRWQNLAGVSDGDFESALADPDDKPSTSGIIRKANGSNSKMDPKALWIWGRMRDFERDDIANIDIGYLLSEMTVTMQADIRRIAPIMADFFKSLEEHE